MDKSILLFKFVPDTISISLDRCSTVDRINSSESDFSFVNKALEGGGFVKVSSEHKLYNPLLRIFHGR